MRRLLVIGAVLAACAALPAAAAPASKPTLATVSQLSGRELYVKRAGKLLRIRRGSRVALGALVVLGPGTKATLRMKLPRGVKATANVLEIARFPKLPAPKASTITRQFGVIAYGVRTHRRLRLEPKLIELRR